MKVTRVPRQLCLFVLALLLLSALVMAAAPKKSALLIGNAHYRTSPLRNPINDATDVAALLKKLGFNVTLVTDADQRTMERSIRTFGRQLRQGGVGLFYYAGHGIQVGGRNYLIPVDAEIETESDVKYEALDAGRILGKMEDAGNRMNIIILDACRDNPFGRGFRSVNRGLARIDAPSGSILAYATSPGKVAADGTGRNGLYTAALLKHMQQPGITIERVFKKVRVAVVKASEGGQIPWESSSLMSDFYFVPAKKVAKASPPPAVAPAPVIAAPGPKPVKPTTTLQKTPSKQEVASISPTVLRSSVPLRSTPDSSLGMVSIKHTLYNRHLYEREINPMGDFKSHLQDNGDGTVSDLGTGLMWQQGGSSRLVSHPNIDRYIQKLNRQKFAGFSDWRMPTLEELISLNRALKLKGLHLDPVFDRTQKRCWTSDYRQKRNRGMGYAWLLDFKSGKILEAIYHAGGPLQYYDRYIKHERNYIKAVRSAK